jgi:hypothetical protein
VTADSDTFALHTDGELNSLEQLAATGGNAELSSHSAVSSSVLLAMVQAACQPNLVNQLLKLGPPGVGFGCSASSTRLVGRGLSSGLALVHQGARVLSYEACRLVRSLVSVLGWLSLVRGLVTKPKLSVTSLVTKPRLL